MGVQRFLSILGYMSRVLRLSSGYGTYMRSEIWEGVQLPVPGSPFWAYQSSTCRVDRGTRQGTQKLLVPGGMLRS